MSFFLSKRLVVLVFVRKNIIDFYLFVSFYNMFVLFYNLLLKIKTHYVLIFNTQMAIFGIQQIIVNGI